MRTLLLVILVLVVSGCAPKFPISSYPTARENTEILQGAARKLKVVAMTPTFTDKGATSCRGLGEAIHLPQKQTFTDYVADALRKELMVAQIHDVNATNVIEMTLTKTDSSSSLGDTNWYINANYTVNGQRFSIATAYNDRSSWDAEKACKNLSGYFPKAVNQHFRQLFEQPEFRAVLFNTNTAAARSTTEGLAPLGGGPGNNIVYQVPPGSKLPAQATPPSTPSAGRSFSPEAESRLEKLKNLFNKGLITEDEYVRERKRVLDAM